MLFRFSDLFIFDIHLKLLSKRYHAVFHPVPPEKRGHDFWQFLGKLQFFAFWQFFAIS